MDKIDYRVLGSRELISLAKKIESALDESVRADGDDSAYKMVQAEIEVIRKDLSENTTEPSVPLSEIRREIGHRLSEGRGTVGRLVMFDGEVPVGESGSNQFFIVLIVDEKGFSFDWEPSDRKLNYCHLRSFAPQIGGIFDTTDQKLLKVSPLEWLTRYLNRTDLFKDVSELKDVDYDEGFEKDSDEQNDDSHLTTGKSKTEDDIRKSIDSSGSKTFSAGLVKDCLSDDISYSDEPSCFWEVDSTGEKLEKKIWKVDETTDCTEETKELIALANEVREALLDRFLQWMTLCRTGGTRVQLNRETDRYYYLSTTVNDDEIIVDWNAWNGQPVRDVYRKVDGGREISDKELLHENPVEWFAKYLNSGMYRKQDAE